MVSRVRDTVDSDARSHTSYVLGMLFCRFISENLTAYLNQQEAS